MIKQFPPEILHWIVPYLEMDDISHLIQTCREISKSLTDLREIIKATKNNSIYERAELLQIAYENYCNLVIDWEELKLELKEFNGKSNAVILRAKNSIIKFKNWDPLDDIAYRISGIKWTGVCKLLYSNPNIDQTKALICASRFGAIDLVPNMLLDSRIDPAYDRNDAIRWATHSDHLEIVRLLLNDSRVNPSDEDNQAIIHASIQGHFEIVQLLLQDPRVDPSVNENEAIHRAIQNGKTEVVRILLEDSRVNPNDQPNDWEEEDVFNGIVHASEWGYFEIVRLLLEDGRVDPSYYNNAACVRAIENGHIEIAQLLVKDQRVRDSTL
jgi:hypothetical protein